MEQLNQEQQTLAVEKVLQEMQQAEEYLQRWNASWWEQLLDAYCLPFHYLIGEEDIRELEDKYQCRYSLSNAFYSNKSIGVPLRKESLTCTNLLTGEKDVDVEVGFGRIDWCGMNSDKASRRFSFYNNGNIDFSKSCKSFRQTYKHPMMITYHSSFNVLKNDFTLNILIDRLVNDNNRQFKFDNCTFAIKDNALVEKLNNLEITKSLDPSSPFTKIVRTYHDEGGREKAVATYQTSSDEFNDGTVILETRKGNGKINGTYRFKVGKNGVHAFFGTRKGINIDLTSNEFLLNILLNIQDELINNRISFLDFVKRMQDLIELLLSQKGLNLENDYINMESIDDTEKRIIEIVKCIKGELPLQGLTNRVNYALDFASKNALTSCQEDDFKLSRNR